MTWNAWTEMWPSEPVPNLYHPPPPQKKKLQTTTRKLSTDIRNENHQIPPEHPLENSNKGLPTPAWELGNPSFTNHISEGPPIFILEDRSLLKTSALALAPPPSPKKLHNKPPLRKFQPRSIGGAPKEWRRRRAEKRSSKRVFWRVRFFSSHLRFSGVFSANLTGAEKKRTLQKHPFRRPFPCTTPSRSFGALIHPKSSNTTDCTPFLM